MIIIALILILLVLGVIFFTYLIPKKLGYPKVGKYIALFFTLSIVAMTIYIIIEDDLFSKSDAQELLMEQDVQLKEDFNLEKNESTFSPGDHYHTFTLSISPNDKQRIINEIKKSPNFLKVNSSESYITDDENSYIGPKRTKNYETGDFFVRELLEPREGYAPIWRKIQIAKNNNKLVFEDIDL